MYNHPVINKQKGVVISMLKTLDEVKNEGKKFLEQFEQLDEDSKRNVIAYMRGLKDGQLLREKTA